jgi:hypothetical protein
MGKGGGGHGGLNILPQKSWNVYNFDNRLVVEQDEVAAHTPACPAKPSAPPLAQRGARDNDIESEMMGGGGVAGS